MSPDDFDKLYATLVSIDLSVRQIALVLTMFVIVNGVIGLYRQFDSDS